MAKELLKEAIADAKAVREVALQNAKMALEEAFDSKIKSMLSAKLAEEIEEDVELEEEYIEEEAEATDEGMSYEEDDKDAANEEFDLEEDIDEEINLDELMAELESLEEGDDEEDDKVDEGLFDKFKNMFKGGESKLADKLKSSNQVDLFKTKDGIEKIKKMVVDMGYDGLSANQMQAFLGLTREKLGLKNTGGHFGSAAGGAFEEGKKGDDDKVEETFDIDALVAEIESEIEEGKKKKDEETVDEAYGDSPGKGTGPAKGKPGAPFGDGKSGKGGTGYDDGAKKLKEERDEALATVESLQETISEMNLLNSKLLYCNKLFRANALTEAQKVKVVDALDKASTTGEAKLVFETLQESFNFTGVEKRAIQEGLGRASKAAGTAPKKVITESVDETVSRFQKLANIKF
jgi:hypothetical protein